MQQRILCTLLVLFLVAAAACKTSEPAKNFPSDQDVSAPPDTTSPDTAAADTIAPDTIAVETPVPDTTVADTIPSGTTIPDTTAADTTASDTTKKADKSAYGDIVGEAEKKATGLLNIYYKDKRSEERRVGQQGGKGCRSQR